MLGSKVFAIYKPQGPTSNAIVQKVKRITGVKKVGHAGTLDPLAKGVLVIGVGREATKKLGEVVAKEKEYLADVFLGAGSTTDDLEGEKSEVEISHKPELGDIEKAVEKFKGNIIQVPPIYSAIKVKGKEAYKLARKGEEVEMKPRSALVKEIEISKYNWPHLELRIVTGPGVYIRSLARDIGRELKTGGYLYSLERTRVGDFKKEDATTLEELATKHQKD